MQSHFFYLPFKAHFSEIDRVLIIDCHFVLHLIEFNFRKIVLFCLIDLYNNKIFNVTNLPNRFESEWTYEWKVISLYFKQSCLLLPLMCLHLQLSQMSAYSTWIIFLSTPTLFPFSSLLLSLPICLLSCKTLWRMQPSDLCLTSFSFLILSNSNQYFLPCSCLLSSYIVSSHLL